MANEIIKGMGFHHIGLATKNLSRSVEFYRALGMKEVARWGEGDREIVMLDIGDGGRFELFAFGNDEVAVNSKWLHFAMRVDDVDAAYAKALEVGAEPLTAPKIVPLEAKPHNITLNIAFVKGPDGEELEFFKEL